MSKYLADVRSVLKNCDIKATDGRSALEVYEEYYEKQKQDISFSLISFGKAFGLEFSYADFKDEKLSGFLQDKRVVINGKQPELRQRFTIAHELGHYFHKHENTIIDPQDIEKLRCDVDSDIPILKAIARDGDINRQELEANEFAGALLMPAELVKSEMASDEETIIPLNQIFGVSKPAWNIRVDNLQK